MPKIAYNGSEPLYGIIRSKTDSTVWDGSDLVAWDDSNLELYALVVDDLDGDLFGFTPPAELPSGSYYAFFYRRLGSSPALSDPCVVEEFRWDGSGESPVISVPEITDADSYFDNKLHAESWTSATDENKAKALANAWLILDRFAYKGVKTVSTQTHEWPRIICGVSQTPNEVLYALYEIAYALLDGFDFEREMRGQNVVSRGYSAVRTTYDVNRTAEHIQAGVPSALAWTYLYPWLLASSTFKIHRVS